jgi:hypothetical protein
VGSKGNNDEIQSKEIDLVADRKFTADEIKTFEFIPISKMRSGVPLPAPVFVYLKRNQRLIPIKPRYQVFSNSELKKLADYENFYFLESLKDIRLVSLRAVRLRQWLKKAYESAKPIPSYIISDEVIRKTAPLWKWAGDGITLKMPLLVTFCCELLGQQLPEKAIQLEDRDLYRFERFIARSSVAVLIGMALGYTELGQLCRIRDAFFGNRVDIPDVESIEEMVERLESPIPLWLDPEIFVGVGDPTFEKFFSRLNRRWKVSQAS